MATELSTPAYSSLPLDPNGPPGNAWGRFGSSDELGMLNLLTPAVVADAAKEIRTGERISLDLPLDYFPLPFWDREPFKQHFKNWGPRGVPTVNDDVFEFNTQSSTQWDGFRHFAHSEFKRFYHDRKQQELESSAVIGVDAWARKGGIVGRGVLVDWAEWAARHDASLSAFEETGIPIGQLKAVVEEQKLEIRAGDILFVRSGFLAAYAALQPDEQRAVAAREKPDLIGVEPSEELLQWLWEKQFAAVGGDALAFETSPPGQLCGPSLTLHNRLLSGWGMPIGELFDLESLAEHCRKSGRWSFFLSSVPLKVPGGVATPANAVAIF